jgi:NodT family efflux transporter outer membrane factor (OMF) lipoprotein
MHRLLASFALLLSGCAVGPVYERPAALPPQASGEFITQSPWVDPLAPLPERWWRLYDDPVLDKLVARALAKNTDIRVAMANLDRARAIAAEARGNRNPIVSIGGGAAYSNIGFVAGQPVPTGGAGGSQLISGVGPTLSWELDLFGRLRSSVAAASADVEATEALRDAVRATIAAETARAYLASCAISESARIVDLSLDNSLQTLRAQEARARIGVAAAFDADRAAVAVEETRAVQVDVAGRRRVALLELSALIGDPPGILPSGASDCHALPTLDRPVPIDDVAALLRRRPDIRAAERRLAADTARIGVATAELYPRFSLLGSAFYHGQQAPGQSSGFSFSLGPVFNTVFPDQRIARARIAQADAQARASLAQFDGEVLRALKEIEQSLTRYDAEVARYAALGEARSRAEVAFEKVEHRHRAGAISLLDLLVAQRELIAARSAHAEARERLASRQIDLFKALGGGWQEGAVEDGPPDTP